MTSKSTIIHATIAKVRTFNSRGDTIFAFELVLREPVANLGDAERFRMQIYQYCLPGRFDLPNMALVSEGDTVSFELEGVEASHGFIEFERFRGFSVNTYQAEVRTR
jgi:hypothetical protein